MLNEDTFQKFLRRNGRSPKVAQEVIRLVTEFEQYLHTHNLNIDQAKPADLEAFVAQVEKTPKASAKNHLWALGYYYEFIANPTMRQTAGALREARIAGTRAIFLLRKFRGVNPNYVAKLEEIGIKNVEQMIQTGRTPADRSALSEKTGIPLEAILEFVKLFDLSRLGAIKSIRARLYYDAGVDTPEKMAQWDPVALRAMLIEYIQRTGFHGIAPLPKELQGGIATAKKAPRLVVYE